MKKTEQLIHTISKGKPVFQLLYSQYQRLNFSDKVVGNIIAEAEAQKHLPRQCLGNLFAEVFLTNLYICFGKPLGSLRQLPQECLI